MKIRLAIVVLVVLVPASTLAQKVLSSGGSDSLCIKFVSDSPGLMLQIKDLYTISGEFPFTFCKLRRNNNYSISLSGDKYETIRGRLELDDYGVPAVKGFRGVTVIQNAVLPGLGTYRRERNTEAILDFTSTAASLFMLYGENEEYNDLDDRLDVLKGYLERAQTIEEKERIQEITRKASLDVNVQNRYRKRLLIFSSYLYAHQLIEPLIVDIPPSGEYFAGERKMLFKVSKRKTWRAFVHSLLKPGRGQFYQGKMGRGVFFSSAAVVAGLIALDLYNQYDKKVSDYDICIEKYNSAVTIDERRHYLSLASSLWNEVEDSETNRDISLYVFCGLWGWSLIDTLFPGEAGESVSGYSFSLTPLGCEIAVRF